MNCQEAFEMLVRNEDHTELAAHLRACSNCREDQASLLRTRSLLAAPETWEEPSPNLAESVALIGRGGVSGASKGRGRWGGLLPVALVAIIVGVTAIVTFDRPDWELSLVPVGEGIGARAVVMGWNEAAGTRLQLEVSGVDVSPPGFYYEIWLTSPDGRHVSGGTFVGSGTVTSVVAARRSEFPRVWITLEPFDGDAGPSPNTFFDTEL